MEKIRVKISTNSPRWNFVRQTPGSLGIWDEYQFFIDDDTAECDWWVVIDGLIKEESVLCPPNHTILITGEPPSIKTYEHKFVQQFNTVITTQNGILASHVITRQLMPWYIGASFNVAENKMDGFTKSYDELTAMTDIPKTKLISIISSNKIRTPGHRQRMKFITILKEHFGDRLDVFGSGVNQIVDKWDGLAPYKYHIAIENSVTKDYWTEKLADAFLAEAYPFYFGCPNIFDYFPADALSVIDIHNPGEAIQIMEEALEKDYGTQRRSAILKSRELILEQYQLFPALCRIISEMEMGIIKAKTFIALRPEKKRADNLKTRIYGKLSRMARNLIPSF